MFRIAPVLTALILLAGCIPGPAPGVLPLNHLPALRGDYFPLESREVGRAFHIYVRLPDGYDPGAAARHPTVYLTDGDSLFPILAANHLFLTYDDGLPEAIVVGIAYGGFDPSVNRRNVDFQTPGDGVAAEAAGAAAFNRFLRTELIPEIERRFRADPARRVLFGQSRGGAFVLWSAIHDPDLFQGRIASNPSLTPGIESLMGPAAPAARDDLGMVIVSGTRDRADLQEEAALWGSTWEARPDRPWRLHRARVEGGTHAANAGDAYRIGMNWLFGRAGPP
jgi:predicted alpha/beta superfamily hydrolase